MKPCCTKQKQIALLAMQALDLSDEREIRRHLESCAGCRAYLDEMTRLTGKLTGLEIRSDIATSEAFHQGVLRKLTPESSFLGEAAVAIRRRFQMFQRLALPVAGAAVLAALGLVLFESRSRSPQLPSSPTPTQAPVTSQAEFNPTVFNFQRAANRSFEELDQLLTRQGSRNSSPAPIYSASSRSLALVLD